MQNQNKLPKINIINYKFYISKLKRIFLRCKIDKHYNIGANINYYLFILHPMPICQKSYYTDNVHIKYR